MIFSSSTPDRGGSSAKRRWEAIAKAYRANETAIVEGVLDTAPFDSAAQARVQAKARDLVATVRAERASASRIDSFLQEYKLSSQEGVALMCLAEALLRIPDSDTAERLIREKLGGADWHRHLGRSDSLLVNASTFGLMLTGRIIRLDAAKERDLFGTLGRLIAKSGEPLIREAVEAAMRILGRQFVMGRTMAEALARAAERGERRYRYSFDMLGEEAKTAAAADHYFAAYRTSIAALADEAAQAPDLMAAPSISVKLSALHPRYDFAQWETCVPAIAGRLMELARQARDVGIGLTVDAEESERLMPSLAIFEQVYSDARFGGWDGLGLAVQAYQKRALPVIDWLAGLSARRRRRIPVRLVKGAYWDSEVKRSQERGLTGYPVFTRKAATDVSWLACAARLFADPQAFYPQLATHNAYSVAAALELAGALEGASNGGGAWLAFEFQRLHGMGRALYDQIVGEEGFPCRVYAPVGSHEDLLPYLVRRLLENGANTSFVNRLSDDSAPVEKIIADPVADLRARPSKPHPRIPLPRDLYGAARLNSRGCDLSDERELRPLAAEMLAATKEIWRAAPLIGGKPVSGGTRPIHDPADHRRPVGEAIDAAVSDADRALTLAQAACGAWNRRPADQRARILEIAADLFEENRGALMARLVREGGKTLPDAIAEVREAADYCRYYGAEARRLFVPQPLPGPTGEDNRLELHGRGTFACISPWNFPLAIFTGQIVAALAAGNAVLAKPAEQTPLTAALAVELLHRAGVPPDVLHFLPGPGRSIGSAMVVDRRTDGVVFTGSTEVARGLAKALAGRDGPIVPLIAETGGQNAMIVDSSALPEQVVADVIASSFQSAGQRCSSLRVLFVQDDIADKLLAMLGGAAMELVIGDPALLSTDIGPVIDDGARKMLEDHALRIGRAGKLLFQVPLSKDVARHGSFFAPRAIEIPSLDLLKREVFGPVLHVIRWQAGRLDAVCDAVAATGYGLTLGIHSRIAETVTEVRERLGVGNTYINRNMIGAVVGVQPFGGEGLSGTGPKAGGPNYLPRFALERTLTVNTTAAGGNASLLTLDEG